MNEVLILARLSIHDLDREVVERYYADIGPALQKVDGYHGVGLWRNVTGDGSHLAVYIYQTLESADEGLRVVAQLRGVTQNQAVLTAPADVTRCRTYHVSGVLATDAPLESFLSLSVRASDPGYGPELADELERIFDELAVFPGYLGAYVGINDSLDEEVVGLVAWRTEADYRSSVPKRPPYELSLYRRVL